MYSPYDRLWGQHFVSLSLNEMGQSRTKILTELLYPKCAHYDQIFKEKIIKYTYEWQKLKIKQMLRQSKTEWLVQPETTNKRT